MSSLFVSLVAVVLLVLVHLFIGKLRFLEGTPRNVWLSIAGGVAVAYVFVHLLPNLSGAQEVIAEAAEAMLGSLERHVYLLALVGLVVFYGLERAARGSRKTRRDTKGKDAASSGVFWLHVTSFAAYNLLIGYLLHSRGLEEGRQFTILFAIAMGLHFITTDFGLREHYKGSYEGIARWIFSGALIIGWVVSFAGGVSEGVRAILLAFLAGGVVLNVLKEELPEERESRFWAFALGAGLYAALLLAV
ncbi:MAG: hypothetical protein M3173_08020 [Chloroflexota bacterium]|nr:hypothetical protein [Chloroflexota bacterium]